MWQRNSGKGKTNILQNQFTKYLITTIDRDKAAYLDRQSKRAAREFPTEQSDIKLLIGAEQHVLESLILEQALDEISRRDRYIFLARVLEKRDYHALAAEIGLGYKGATAAYYRVLQKLRQALRGE